MGTIDFQLSYSLSFALYLNFLILTIQEIYEDGFNGENPLILAFLVFGFIITFSALIKRKYIDASNINMIDYLAVGFNFVFAALLLKSFFKKYKKDDENYEIIRNYLVLYLVITIWSAFNAGKITAKRILARISDK